MQWRQGERHSVMRAHRMTHGLVLLVALRGCPPCLDANGCFGAARQSPKPVNEITFHIDGGPPPVSLDDLWNASPSSSRESFAPRRLSTSRFPTVCRHSRPPHSRGAADHERV